MPIESRAVPNRVFALGNVTLGDIATASFVLCAGSGAILAAAYDPHNAARSIAAWLLTNPAAIFLRNIHYWTAQFFVIFTLLHVWDHLRASTERNVRRGVWLRLVMAVPVIAFLPLSGFLLRGDADAQQAQRIIDTVISQIPMAGSLLATLLFGTEEGPQVVYVQHAAAATIIVLIIIVEHGRRLWPRLGGVAAVSMTAAFLSALLSPGLHDGMVVSVKGPWYFLGLQEILHWTPRLPAILAAAVIALLLLWAVPRLPLRWAVRAKVMLFAGTIAYLLLCGIGLFLRAENWNLRPNWPRESGDLRAGLIWGTAPAGEEKTPAVLPVVLGRNEGCLVCHADIQGFSDAHRPESVGCAACHGGDIFTLNKDRAHARMIRVPGNMANAERTCGQAECHAAIVPRIQRSIMTTSAGIISADRRVFGEAVKESSPPPHIRDIGTSAADIHLRQLCASCHLGQEKTGWGAITQESRGGGCNACHLSYSSEAAEGLARYKAIPRNTRKAAPAIHPALSIAADDSRCFGCHSRSSRISTSYEGWYELYEAPETAGVAGNSSTPSYRRLDDGRIFARALPDIHQERGLACIDCHTATDIMGTGSVALRKGDQERVRCEDCHARQIASTPAGSIEPEALKLLSLRKWMPAPTDRIGIVRNGGTLVNVRIDGSDRAQMLRKKSGEPAEMRAPLPVCGRSRPRKADVQQLPFCMGTTLHNMPHDIRSCN